MSYLFRRDEESSETSIVSAHILQRLY